MSSRKEDDDKSVKAARKVDREREATQAMREYHAEKARVDANTERLRALRLAKEAADAQRAAKKAPAAAKSGRKTRASA